MQFYAFFAFYEKEAFLCNICTLSNWTETLSRLVGNWSTWWVWEEAEGNGFVYPGKEQAERGTSCNLLPLGEERWCMVKREQSQVRARENPTRVKGEKYLQWLSTGTAYSEELCHLHPWRFAYLTWTRPWAAWHNFEVGPALIWQLDLFTSGGCFQN